MRGYLGSSGAECAGKGEGDTFTHKTAYDFSSKILAHSEVCALFVHVSIVYSDCSSRSRLSLHTDSINVFL